MRDDTDLGNLRLINDNIKKENRITMTGIFEIVAWAYLATFFIELVTAQFDTDRLVLSIAEYRQTCQRVRKE